jgi:hypothetical protein
MRLNLTAFICGSAALAASFLAALPSYALSTWELTNVVFANGDTASGTFTYDPSANGYFTNIDITVEQSGTNTVVATFTDGDLVTSFSSYNKLLLCDPTAGTNVCATGSSPSLYLYSALSLGSGVSSISLVNNQIKMTKYGLYGSTTQNGLISGTLTLIPFEIPGGSNTVLLTTMLSLGILRTCKKRLPSLSGVSSVQEISN